VRLRYGFVLKCIGMKDGAVHCTYYPDSKSGTPGADKYKVKGNIHWVSVKHAHAAEVRLYDRLFRVAHPEGTQDLNPESVRTVTAQLEESLRPEGLQNESAARFQFERHGYFIADRRNPAAFNRTVSLKDSWAAR
jgi:glutaminyl-tRNA synthetase